MKMTEADLELERRAKANGFLSHSDFIANSKIKQEVYAESRKAYRKANGIPETNSIKRSEKWLMILVKKQQLSVNLELAKPEKLKTGPLEIC